MSDKIEKQIAYGYNSITGKLDSLASTGDLWSDLGNAQPGVDAAVEILTTHLIDQYKSLPGAESTTTTKFGLLTGGEYTEAEIVGFGVKTMNDYLQVVVPIIEKEKASLETLLHFQSLSMLAGMMRANLETDEFQYAIDNPESNFEINEDEEGKTYLNPIKGSFLEAFVDSVRPENTQGNIHRYSELIRSHTNSSLAEEDIDQESLHHACSLLGSIYYYDQDLFAQLAFYGLNDLGLDLTTPWEDLVECDEDKEDLIEESPDFEFFARIQPGSYLEGILFIIDGIRELDPLERYRSSKYKLFGTVPKTKDRICPAGRSLQPIMSGRNVNETQNITVSYLKAFINVYKPHQEEE